jgi:hypothetical protein
MDHEAAKLRTARWKQVVIACSTSTPVASSDGWTRLTSQQAKMSTPSLALPPNAILTIVTIALPF